MVDLNNLLRYLASKNFEPCQFENVLEHFSSNLTQHLVHLVSRFYEKYGLSPHVSQNFAKVGRYVIRDSSKIARDHYQVDKARAIFDEDRMTDCPEFCEIL